jgi:hypothetical protein
VDSDVSIVATRQHLEMICWRSSGDALDKVREGPHLFSMKELLYST